MGERFVRGAFSFLQCYSKRATLARDCSRPLWVFKPKLHYYHHLVVEASTFLLKEMVFLNPLAYSCAMAEDFIGKASLISRRVSARTCERRTLQRYLVATMQAWKKDPQ